MKRIFVFGAPRSGTTWVQLLLAQHPRVATACETHLFARYLSCLADAWEWDLGYRDEPEIGISHLLGEDEFRALCRNFGDAVLERILERSPGADTVVEKTPGHVLHADLIRALYPDAHLIHVVRDPRAVVASLRRAGRGWGSRWAPTGAASGTVMWRRSVEQGLRASHDHPRFRQVRYEELAARPSTTLQDIFRFVGLEAEQDVCRRAVDSCSIDRLKNGEGPASAPWNVAELPEGFIGRGEPESWRRELTARQVGVVQHGAADLMDELGYRRSRAPAGLPLCSWLRAFLRRLHAGLEWRLRHCMQRL